MEAAVPYAATGVFVNQGQACIAASRLYVQSGIYDKFVKKAVEHAKKIKIGNPTDPNTQHGPQVFFFFITFRHRHHYQQHSLLAEMYY